MDENRERNRVEIKLEEETPDPFETRLKEKALRDKREEFDRKVMQLANKVVDYQQKGPDFQYLADMMLTFLDVTVQLQGTMEVLSAVNDAMTCLTEAIDFIDSSLNYDRELIAGSLKVRYGFFARFKQRRQIRRAIRNNTNRMLAMVESINGKFGMAMALTDSLKNACYKMKKMMDKSRAKSEKRRSKMDTSGGSVPIAGSTSATEAVLAEVRRSRGMDGAEAPTGGSAPAASASGSGTGSGTASGGSAGGPTGIDDIL